MGKFKHKITKEVHDRIYETAKSLPKLYRQHADGSPVYKDEIVDGSFINQSGIRDKNGNQAIPGNKYRAPVLQYYDHVKSLVYAYQNFGESAVQNYVDEINRIYTERQAITHVLLRPWYSKVWWWISRMFTKK